MDSMKAVKLQILCMYFKWRVEYEVILEKYVTFKIKNYYYLWW